MERDDEVDIAIQFKGQMAERARVVKRHLGVRHNEEIIRVLLNKEYRKMMKTEEKAAGDLTDLEAAIKKSFPPEFVEYVRRLPRRTMTLADLVEELKKWQRK